MPFAMINNIPVFGVPLVNAVEQMDQCIVPRADHVAMMADHHVGYSMPIGGVAAYRNLVSPSAVGYDIGCGNKAVRVNAGSHGAREDIVEIMDTIWNGIQFGIGKKNFHGSTKPVQIFEANREGTYVLKDMERDLGLKSGTMFDLANDQFGTIGAGNHYIDVMIDEQDRVWIGTHCGSRGLGHKIASWFLKKGGGVDSPMADPVMFQDDSWLGIQYLNAMGLAGAYANENRTWIIDKVLDLLGWNAEEEVHNHHNYAWRESHFGEPYWVIRKGATPARPGQKGFIGGSMGDNAVIVEGVEGADSATALYSTVHGAGRAMSRGEAKGKTNFKTGEVKREAQVTQSMMDEWITEFGVELRGGDVDEAPQAYKRLSDVLEAHAGTINVLHTLKPIGVAMAEPGKRKW